jgi:hypothetical protein
MLKDIQKLLGSLYYEYEYWVQDAWVGDALHMHHKLPWQPADMFLR